MYYPFETRVTPLAHIQRERLLPAPGEILVEIGERVEPTQVVAQATYTEEFHTVPIARKLKIKPSKVKSTLRVEVGEAVRKNEVIAARGGLSSRSVRAPADGILTAVGSGRALIEPKPKTIELAAYIPGRVSKVMAGEGVRIETMGALIQGKWGCGGEGFGVLKSLVNEPDRPIRARDIDPSCHGTILVGGAGLNEKVLDRAVEMQVRGIVTGGLPSELISAAKAAPFPIIVTEGIGPIPMADPVFELLETNDGREASINGKIETRWGVTKPEVIIALPADTVPPDAQPGVPLTVGAQVRITRAPYMGLVGVVTDIPDIRESIETGARVRGAEVDLGDEAPVLVPLANLELLR